MIIDAAWFNTNTNQTSVAVSEQAPVTYEGSEGYALSFDGKTDHIRTPIKIDELQPLTLEAWVTKPENWQRGQLISNAHNAGISLALQSDHAYFMVMQDKPYNKYLIVKSDSLPESSTFHVAGVFDGSSLHIFVDGQLKNSVRLEGSFIPSKDPLQIGGNPTGNRKPGEPIRAIIDEVRISKTARYQGDFVPSTRHKADDLTLALYHFDEGRGDVLKDFSGKGHHGKIVGANWVGGGSPAKAAPKGTRTRSD